MRTEMVKYKVKEDVYQVISTEMDFGEIISEDDFGYFMRKILTKDDVWVECVDEETGELELYCLEGEDKGEDSRDMFDITRVMEYLIKI